MFLPGSQLFCEHCHVYYPWEKIDKLPVDGKRTENLLGSSMMVSPVICEVCGGPLVEKIPEPAAKNTWEARVDGRLLDVDEDTSKDIVVHTSIEQFVGETTMPRNVSLFIE